MALEPPERRYRWLHPKPGTRQYAVLAGAIQTYWSHWLYPPEVPRVLAVRCRGRDGQLCDWCVAGTNLAKTRYVVPLLLCGAVSKGTRPRPGPRCWLLELGGEHFDTLTSLEQQGVGQTLLLDCPEGGTRADLRIEFLTREYRLELPADRQYDIRSAVAEIGLTELGSLGRRVIVGLPETYECPSLDAQS